MAAVLARRIVPKLLPNLTAEAVAAVKGGLLQAIQASSSSASMHRKVCDTIGRLGAEFHEQNAWPELDAWMQSACSGGDATAQATALSILEHMAPALVSTWHKHGASMHGVCQAGLACAALPVRIAALRLLTALLRACSELEHMASKAKEKKALRSIAAALSDALPQTLAVLEASVESARGSSSPRDLLTALENLSTLAEHHPKFFKQALPSVAAGLSRTALSPSLPCECRIGAVELLLTLAEGAPSMCAKLRSPSFSGQLLDTLLPMMLRLPDDSGCWEEGEPDDGLSHGDGDDEEESEPVYAMEALDRLAGAMDGDTVGGELMARLGALGPEAAGGWKQTHLVLVSIAIVSEHCTATLAPHLPALIQRIVQTAAANEVRLRWACFFALAVLGDEFEQIAREFHPQLLPLIARGLADGAPRVQSAAAVAMGGMCAQLPLETLLIHANDLLSALHAIMSSPAARGFVVSAAAGALTSVCKRVGGHISAAVYSGLMPLLRQRLAVAVASKGGSWLVAALVEAMGALVRAAGAHIVTADTFVMQDVHMLLGLLTNEAADQLAKYGCDITESGEATVHAALAAYGSLVGEPFGHVFRVLLPMLLSAATIDPDFSISRVEEEMEEEDDDYEVSYTPEPSGKGLIRSRVNVAKTTAKIVGLRAVAQYVEAFGVGSLQFVEAIVNAILPVLQFRFHPAVRASAARALGACYQQVVLAAGPEPGALVSVEQASLLLGTAAKVLHRRQRLALRAPSLASLRPPVL